MENLHNDIQQAIGEHELPPRWASSALQFANLLQKWNQKINLTAGNSKRDFVSHIVDSLFCANHFPTEARTSVDVGSGGGFPIILLAQIFPTCEFHSVESNGKKTAFLNTCKRELGLANLTVHRTRLEQFSNRGFNVATSRATFELSQWLALGKKLVVPNGLVIGFSTPNTTHPEGVVTHSYSLFGKPRTLVFSHQTGSP